MTMMTYKVTNGKEMTGIYTNPNRAKRVCFEVNRRKKQCHKANECFWIEARQITKERRY